MWCVPCLALLLATSSMATTSSAAQVPVDELHGAVVTLGPAPTRVLAAARDAVPIELRAVALEARAPADDPSVDASLEAAEAAWAEADFAACRDRVAEISSETLLARADLSRAGRHASLAARCAFGLGELEAARSLVRGALIAELPGVDAGSPDYRQLVDRERADVATLPRVPIEVVADVPRLRLFVDGRASRCTTSPCAIELTRGAHVIVVEALGRTTSVSRVDVEQRRVIEAHLVRASPADALRDVERALAEGLGFDDPILHDALASILEEPIVVLSWARGAEGHALVVDRTLGRVLARASASGDDASAVAVRAALGEWWGIARPVPIGEDPVFWTIMGVSAVVVGVGAGLLIALVPSGEPDVVVRF